LVQLRSRLQSITQLLAAQLDDVLPNGYVVRNGFHVDFALLPDFSKLLFSLGTLWLSELRIELVEVENFAEKIKVQLQARDFQAHDSQLDKIILSLFDVFGLLVFCGFFEIQQMNRLVDELVEKIKLLISLHHSFFLIIKLLHENEARRLKKHVVQKEFVILR
jgi:hypothetical protein